MIKLTIEEALCIVNIGWSTQEEKELYHKAFELIRETAKKKHLEYQIQVRNQKLAEDKTKTI